MKTLLLCLLPAAVHAQVVECPKYYPSTDTAFSEVPAQHKGKGVVTRQPLTGAGLNVGEFNGGGDIEGLRKDVKGGYEIDFGKWPGPKWFVCTYGKGYATSWWEQLDNKEGNCKLKVVSKNAQGMMDATLTCK
jgi:hypothetical protein